ncbi:MAG: hypothetical protein IH987_14315 [Planctomycetes bacterium]|nr:hypothetical protein [Planctomycetota bacterium]
MVASTDEGKDVVDILAAGSSRRNKANTASRRRETLKSDRLPIVQSPFG